MLFSRESGILLHPTSLPGKHGIGDLGPEAIKWLDCLAEAGQKLWQVLPLGPTGYGDSPYQGLSSFAGNPLLISLDLLVKDELLDPEALEIIPRLPQGEVLYEKVIQPKQALLQKAAQRFLYEVPVTRLKDYVSFCEKESWWLDDFALYVAIKERQKLRPWSDWPEEYRDRDPEALDNARERLFDAIEEQKALQYFFYEQWATVRTAANERGIRIIGDMPIFIAHDSAGVWSHPELFKLDDQGQPTVIAGVPPDYFSKTGQRWGNPLYRWDLMAKDGYAWWKKRVAKTLEQVDIVRVDHFRGFAAYWEIPGDEPTAIHGKWVDGPGKAFFDEIVKEFGKTLPILAEDLGNITEDVIALRDGFGLPGMRILQFAFGTDPMKHTFLPEAFVENCIAYSGTHDNDTVCGWFHDDGSASSRTSEECETERQACLEVIGGDGNDIAWDFIETLLNSKAGAVIFPMQDVLGLGSEARMNTPGNPSGNWRWRMTEADFTPEMIKRLAKSIKDAGR
ncbi:4-alpha-glucanotransferase [Rubellicoccus peritrichatus]|uniref:4-alpha-glucanotransferase n=1 Tax=Rubellicoccus peritrichatus TaxID=3080537 RepID=A0AAQ3L5A8_9BACT|nr:4-alpha-glucanotransferase [Puniceicoccus sp. CR14]WOO39425.1 4-alpha-glucanotransferase [Puniceicoccus sp. CR14]